MGPDRGFTTVRADSMLRMPSGHATDSPAVIGSGWPATMTVMAMGLGYAMSMADPTILSANMSQVRTGLHATPSTASFIASLATLTMAAAVLGAGTLGDLYGMRRMFVIGLFGTIAFGVLAAALPSAAVLVVARAGVGVALAFCLVCRWPSSTRCSRRVDERR